MEYKNSTLDLDNKVVSSIMYSKVINIIRIFCYSFRES